MAVNLGKITSLVMRAGARAGVVGTCTITRPPRTINEESGVTTGGTLTQTVRAAQVSAQRKAPTSDAAWVAARARIEVAANDCSWTPKVHDRVTWAGATSTITALHADAPAGVPVSYELALG
jgi:hypothetical protein